MTEKKLPGVAAPSSRVTTRLPEVAWAGIVAVIALLVQLAIVADAPLNVTEPAPWVAPKFAPEIVIVAPGAPEFGCNPLIPGAGAEPACSNMLCGGRAEGEGENPVRPGKTLEESPEIGLAPVELPEGGSAGGCAISSFPRAASVARDGAKRELSPAVSGALSFPGRAGPASAIALPAIMASTSTKAVTLRASDKPERRHHLTE